MQVTRLLEQLLRDQLQNHRPAVIDNIQNYTNSLAQALAGGYSKSDVAAHVMLEVDEAMKERVNWQAVKCSKGCAFCCHVNVHMTEGEAQCIIDYCDKKNIAINKEVLQAQLTLSDSERPIDKYAKCAFLGEDSACNIYEARPLNCRKHLSLSDPVFCKGDNDAAVSVTANFEIKTEILVSAYNSLGMREGTMAEMLLNNL